MCLYVTLIIILIGTERKTRDRRSSVLILAIVLGVICNYYITFMPLIIVTIDVLIRLTGLKKWSIGRTAVILSEGIPEIDLSMVVVLLVVLTIRNGKMDEARS